MNIKYILLLFMSFLPYSSFANIDTSLCTPKTFIVSGYYSSLPNQTFYYRENYDREIRLNGRGTHGASGQAVFNGMIAAPKNYKFGTKIYFPQYGVGEVHDRGQAIVNAGVRGYSNDRIDIWMGHGEDGLKRALSFGKQKVTGYICPDNVEVGFNMNNFLIHEKFFDVLIWSIYLEPGRKDQFVKTLQKYLYKLGYLKKEHQTGYYGEVTKQAVCSFQQKMGLTYPGSGVCGYFGPRTRNTMKNLAIANKLFNNSFYKKLISINELENINLSIKTKKENLKEEKNINTKKEEILQKIKDEILKEENNITKDKKQEKEEKLFVFTRGIGPGERSAEVGHLQEALKTVGYYEGKISYEYDDNTLEAVYNFQLDQGIINHKTDSMVKGYFGPSTRASLNGILIQQL
ncbi:peptidoglycan-binding protein [Candidatus Vampirococcus lugosii]|uniref:Peptidoglycan-binding (PGRP) domain n=1 Tax=Candidatus Vampirococcus lugosii TaxID=2789015 RepID=A0ABS5QN91_9BACT|nr:peptidoglycan-binding protein [Candidatus Vampirococcus lugosii]MBS8122439.1 Peptidoglycan-binding (PGRP) domain [Candidatus Vampirococcus lugosii]